MRMGSSAKPHACDDCKRRRVKCDYRAPTCERCERAQIACKGYKRKTRFIIRTPSKAGMLPQSISTPSPSFDDSLQELRSQFQKTAGNRSRLRTQSLSLLKKLYLPQLSPASLEKSPVFSWLPMVCNLLGTSRALDHSLYTFCAIQVAITQNSSIIGVEEALQIYYSSLQILKVELEDENAAQKDEILAAISVLSTCELFVCPTDHAWQAHAQGICEILRIRGDVDISTSIQRRLYFRIRLILLFEALCQRLSGPMASSQLIKLMPVANKLDSLSQVIDIAWDIPAVLEDSGRIMASSNVTTEHSMQKILSPSLHLIAKLEDNQRRYRDELEEPPYWALPSVANFPTDEFYDAKLFPFALHFRSIETATHQVLFWAISLQVYCNIINLHLHFSPKSKILAVECPYNSRDFLDSKFANLASVKEEADKLARYICQSIEYCYRFENGTVGPQLTCYAQWILKVYFRQLGYERELAWCRNIKGIRGSGFQVGLTLMCFENEAFEIVE